ncbi:MAG: hypothetical protein KDB23_11180 [Planctomycetales bacterium]|nr:hypothetical protein [Planctomycetales bacterium]
MISNSSHLDLFGDFTTPDLKVVLDGSTLTDRRSALDGNFTLSAGSKYYVSNGGLPMGDSQSSDALSFALDDSVVEFDGGTYNTVNLDVNSTTSSSVNLIGSYMGVGYPGQHVYRGQTQLNLSAGAQIRDGRFTALDDVVGRVVDSTLPSLTLKDRADFRVNNSTVIESNVDDNWHDGFLRGSGESQVAFDNVLFKNGSDCNGPLFSNADSSQLKLRNSDVAASWSCSPAIAISASDRSKVLVESTRIAIENMLLNVAVSGTTLFSAEGAAQIEVRGGEYDSDLIPADSWRQFMAIASARGDSRIVLDGGSYSQHAFGIELSTHLAHAVDDATIELVAGSFDLSINQDAMSDGLIHLNAEDRGTIIVYGSDFNYPLGEVPDLAGTLEGKLIDGNLIRWRFARATDARIILVPEPSGPVIAGLAIPLLVRTLRRSKKEMSIDSPRNQRRTCVELTAT